MPRLLFCLLFSFGLLCSFESSAQDSLYSATLPDSILPEKSPAVLAENGPQSPLLNIATDPVSTDAAPQAPKAPSAPPLIGTPLSFRSLAIPSALITYGAYTFANKDLQKLNLQIRKEVWEERGHKKTTLDNFSIVAPVVAVYALNLAGVKGKHNFVDRSALYGMSYLIGTGVVGSIKRLSGVIRPDSSNRYSFPSGHTAQAFIAAEFMRQEYKDVSPWYGVAGYAVAAGTGYLRMYNNKHWFNDVIAGAGVGIISTRLSYWLYPKIKNIFVKDKTKEINTVVMPTYQNGAVGFGLVHKFK
jgi:hypothetical protein